MSERTNITSGTEWEKKFSYSRAVKINKIIEVAGTTAVDNEKVIDKDDPYKQAVFIFEKIEKALKELGSDRKNVIRTRMYVTDISRSDEIGKAHGEFFKDINPASTMVEVSSLIHPDLLVEIEVTAIL